MLTTPENIRTLQRKLYRKAKQEPACRFHALYDKVYRADILSHAYALVRANKGSAGIDGVTFAAIEEREGGTAFIAELEEALRSKTYKPDPVRRVMIPKADGNQRPLGIPTIRDRVAQMAVKLVIEPIFEADFCDSSYGFRPKKSAHDAVDDVAHSLNKGSTKRRHGSQSKSRRLTNETGKPTVLIDYKPILPSMAFKSGSIGSSESARNTGFTASR